MPNRQTKISARELARRVHRAHSSVSEWAKRRDWPFGPPPWRATKSFVGDVKTWMEATLDSSPAKLVMAALDRPDKIAVSGAADNSDDKDYWLARKYRNQCLVEEGRLIDRNVYRSEWMSRIATAKNKLIGMPGQIAPSLVGQDVGDIEHILRDRIETIIREIGRGDDTIAKGGD